MLWLLGPMALVLAPHALHLPGWISLAWLAFAGVALYSIRYRRRPAGGLVKAALALAGTLGVLAEYGTLLGPRGGVALLAFLSGAKLLETHTARDRLGQLFVVAFLLVAHFLDAQSLLTAGYMVLALLGLLAGLIATQFERPDWRPILALAARILVQALPLALLIFLLFPRMQGPLWGLPVQAAGASGLSDRMTPGDISRLILSDELAFRAQFFTGNPELRSLYWRGPVLWDFDGRTWLTQPALRGGAIQAEGHGSPARYAVTLEPQGTPWLPLLGLPQRLPDVDESRLGPDLQWQAKNPLTRRQRYEVEAYLDYRLEPALPPGSRTRALTLPASGNPRARALAESWSRTAQPAGVVEAALELFRSEAFFYTLNPPLLGEDALDQFLFETRRGFCEHYAGAFVFLMRAAGVPARVVTGYQGGEWNALAGHWMVRGRDAHAWAEVWLEGRGWQRVDPTAAVAPSRVERGVAAALPAGERPGGMIRLDGAWLTPVRLGWDLINNQWNQWVLGYNQERQRQFLASLNPWLASWKGMVWGLALGGSVLVMLAALALLPRLRETRQDPALNAWRRFQRKLTRAGVAPDPAEGPEDYARRARAARPDLKVAIRNIARLYLACRYGPEGAAALPELLRAVREFRPRRNPPATLAAFESAE